MEKLLTIGEVARLLDVPESTLRFWQEKGIFSVPKNEKNNYRQYTIPDLIDIAEMAFYRNIGVPVRVMKNFSRFTLADYEHILDGVEGELEAKMVHLRAMLEALTRKRNHIENIEYLKNMDFVYGRVPFAHVVKFDYSDRDKVIRYTKDPSLYVRCIDTRTGGEARGIIAESVGPADTLLWQGATDQDYAVFLVTEIASEGYRNDIAEKLALIRRAHETGILLAEFLLSETSRGQRIDYMRAYVELV